MKIENDKYVPEYLQDVEELEAYKRRQEFCEILQSIQDFAEEFSGGDKNEEIKLKALILKNLFNG